MSEDDVVMAIRPCMATPEFGTCDCHVSPPNILPPRIWDQLWPLDDENEIGTPTRNTKVGQPTASSQDAALAAALTSTLQTTSVRREVVRHPIFRHNFTALQVPRDLGADLGLR